MKEMLKKQISLTLALLLMFSLVYTTGAVYAAPLADGQYNVQTSLMRADNINAPSMAAGLLFKMVYLKLKVVNGF